jgi:hypothetical protein
VETLVRYTSIDGERQVILTAADDCARCFALSDVPGAGFAAPGVHFLLGAHATRAEAENAAARHARLASEVGTYEARAVCVGLCREEDVR